MSWGMVAVGAGTLVGGVIAADSANRAANTQAAAAGQANDTQRYMFEQQRQDAQPWRQAGMSALAGLQQPGFQQDFSREDFQNDPGYQFRMAEGQKALQASAAARGSLNSGATMKALTRYSQGVASDEYSNAYNRFNADRDRRFNRLSALAGVGQTANSQVAQAGQNYANQVSQNQIGVGNARAASQMAFGNQLSGGINNAASLYAITNMNNKKT